MNFWIKLAWRNLWRNRLRTTLQMFLIAGSVYTGVVFHNLAFGNYRNMIKQATRMGSGQVAIYDTLWFSTRRPSRFFRVSEVIPFLESEDVKVFYERLYLPAFVGKIYGGFPVQLIALDFIKEGKDHPILKGLNPPSRDGVVIGKVLARRLNVKEGDRIYLITREANGHNEGLSLIVAHVIDVPIKEINCCVAFADIGYVRDKLGYGDAAHEVAIILKRGTPEGFAKRLNYELPSPLRAYTWKEAMKELVSAIALDYSGLIFIMLFLYVVVSIGTANVMFMSVMDRTKEFGILRAMGMRPSQVSFMVMLEGVVLGLFAALIGLSLAILTNCYLYRYGLDLRAIYRTFSSEGFTYGGVVIEPVVKSAWEWKGTLGYTLFVVFLAAFASYLPARWINGFKVSDILRK